MKHIFLKFIFSSLFFIAFMGGVKSQTIEGVVLNESNKPLPGATVSIKTHNLAMSTNDKGEFNFTKVPIGEVRLRVTFIGYKPQEKTIEITETSTKKLNFNMEIESTELSEVSVIGTSGGANNIEKISKEYLNRIQAADMKDIFIDLPSVTVGGGGTYGQRIYLRGIESSNLNVTIDGAKQGGSLFQHRGNAGSIDPGLLKEVSVSTSSDATLGSGGLGGSISFSTIDAQDLDYRYGKIGGKISASVTGASNGYVPRAILGTKFNEYLGLLIAASYDKQNNYRSNDTTIVPYTGAETQNYFAKLSVLGYKSHELRASAEYNRSEGDYITGGSGSDMGTPDITQSATHTVTKRGTYTLDYKFKPGSPLVNLNANAYYNHRNMEMSSDITDNTMGVSIKNDLVFNIKELKNKITLGADYENEERTSVVNSGDDVSNSATVVGVFVQGHSKISMVSVSYGVRWDNYRSEYGTNSLDGDKISPNAGLSVEPIKGMELFANYSTAVRASGTIPVQWMSSIADSVSFNNGKPLEAETSVMFDGGIRFSKEKIFAGNDELSVSAKGFKTKMDNLIEVTVGGKQGLPVSGIGNDPFGVISKGYELSLDYQIKNLINRFTYIHTDVENEDGEPIEATRRKAAPSGDRFNWNLSWQPIPELQVGYTLNLVGKLNDVYEIPRPAYVLHNVQLLWFSQTVKGLSAALAVNNLFDKQYREQTSIAQGEAIILEPGRDLRVTLSYKF